MYSCAASHHLSWQLPQEMHQGCISQLLLLRQGTIHRLLQLNAVPPHISSQQTHPTQNHSCKHNVHDNTAWALPVLLIMQERMPLDAPETQHQSRIDAKCFAHITNAGLTLFTFAGTRQLVLACCAFGNSVTLPLVFLLALLPTAAADRATGYLALFMMGWSPMLWTYGLFLLNRGMPNSQPGQRSRQSACSRPCR